MKWRIALAAALIVSALVSFGALLWRLSRTLDGVGGILCIRRNTEFAPGYTERAFEKVSPGMTERNARNMLGAPISEGDIPEPNVDIDRVLYYSTRERPGPYRLRTLLMFRGKVARVVAECTVD